MHENKFLPSIIFFFPAHEISEANQMGEKPPIVKATVITIIFILVFIVFIPFVFSAIRISEYFVALSLHRILGILIFATGAAVSLYCIKDFLFKGSGTPAPIDPPKHLVTQGLFRYMRNPMYAGVFITLSGQTMFFWSVDILFYLICMVIIFNLVVVFYEEPKLRKTFGSSYEQYCHDVNRWLPTFRSRQD
jgi:protein-S-isoprenylcysteine O-methyltransferase Ste14